MLQLLIRIPRVAFSRKRIHSLVLLISLLKRHVLLLCLLSSSYACIRRIPTTIDITATIHRHHRWRSSDTPDGLSRHIFPVRIGAVHPRFERLVVVKFRVVPQFRFGHFLPRFVLFELKLLFEKKRESCQTRPDVKRTTTISRCFARRENASAGGKKRISNQNVYERNHKEEFEKKTKTIQRTHPCVATAERGQSAEESSARSSFARVFCHFSITYKAQFFMANFGFSCCLLENKKRLRLRCRRRALTQKSEVFHYRFSAWYIRCV